MPLLFAFLFAGLSSGLPPVAAQAAKMDKEFACYTAMNKPSLSTNFILGEKMAVHPAGEFSFYAMTKDAFQACRVPSNASPADPAKKPKLLRVTLEKEVYHFQYPEAEEHLYIKGAPPFHAPECTELSGPKREKILAEVLEDRIAESRQFCVMGPSFGTCLSDFIARLKKCEGIPLVKDFVKEIGRSAAAHAKPAPAREGTKSESAR